MKLMEMADLLSGLTDAFERCLKTTDAKDLRVLADFLRGYGDQSVVAFCDQVASSRTGATGGRAKKGATEAPQKLLAEINDFRMRRDAYDWGQVQRLTQPIFKLKTDELKALAAAIGVHVKGKKAEMAAQLATWLRELKSGDRQASFTLSA